jgi:hypothetical protein
LIFRPQAFRKKNAAGAPLLKDGSATANFFTTATLGNQTEPVTAY